VLLKSAQNLLETDFMSESDPYVTLELTGELHTGLIWRSKTIQDNNSPVWNEKVQWLVHSIAQCVLVVKVFDEDDMGKDDFLGYAIVQLKDCDLASGRGMCVYLCLSFSLVRHAALTCACLGCEVARVCDRITAHSQTQHARARAHYHSLVGPTDRNTVILADAADSGPDPAC